jgi:predicted glutamine amidotransferase
MCLIIAIKSGVEKYSDFLMSAVETASFSNTDGIGFTFKRKSTGKIFITKGYQSFKDFKKAYTNKNLSDKDEVLIHLRIGNRGAKNTSMNHPFVVSDKPDEILLNNCYINKPTLVHNGTFIDYSLTGSSFSDTYFFVKDFMSIKESHFY